MDLYLINIYWFIVLVDSYLFILNRILNQSEWLITFLNDLSRFSSWIHPENHSTLYEDKSPALYIHIIYINDIYISPALGADFMLVKNNARGRSLLAMMRGWTFSLHVRFLFRDSHVSRYKNFFKTSTEFLVGYPQKKSGEVLQKLLYIYIYTLFNF